MNALTDKMRILRPAVAAPLLALVFAACGGGGGSSDETASPTADSPTHVTRERAGIRLSLSVDREVYGLGEPVQILAEAENVTSFSIGLEPVPPGQPPLRLSLLSTLNAAQYLGEDADGEFGQTLERGKKISRGLDWDQQLATYQTPVQAPPGQYTIVAELLVANSAGGGPIAVTAALNVELEGGESIISSEEAIGIAIHQPGVKEWFSVRSHSVVCEEGNRDLFYIADVNTGNVAESLKLVYDAQLANGLAICSPVTEGEAWRLIFFSAEGPAPNRISVFLDLKDGTFRRVEEGGPRASPAN